jgi:hypothetical protein
MRRVILIGAIAALAFGLVGCHATAGPSSMPQAAVTPAPAPTPTTTHLHVVIGAITFDDTAHADASSPTAGSGKLQSALVVDASDPGPNKDCNTVDETGTFTFAAGTITYRSWHRDCNFGGPRIQTIFAITGGTGAWAGATGWGTERDDAPDGFAYDGTITTLAVPIQP